MENRLANEIKCCQMSLNEGDPAPPVKQTQFDLSLPRLEHVQSTEYLEITIKDNLDWGQHISEISCEATKTIGFLQRSLAFTPRHT